MGFALTCLGLLQTLGLLLRLKLSASLDREPGPSDALSDNDLAVVRQLSEALHLAEVALEEELVRVDRLLAGERRSVARRAHRRRALANHNEIRSDLRSAHLALEPVLRLGLLDFLDGMVGAEPGVRALVLGLGDADPRVTGADFEAGALHVHVLTKEKRGGVSKGDKHLMVARDEER